MLRTFNCGIGMALFVNPSKFDQICKILKDHGEDVYIIGEMKNRNNDKAIFH